MKKILNRKSTRILFYVMVTKRVHLDSSGQYKYNGKSFEWKWGV